MNGFPTRTPGELEACTEEKAWLVEALWSTQGVGIVGGEPKCGKTFLALHIAVAVAAGVPCLKRFPTRAGPVLLFAAEDAPHILRQRLDGIAAASGAALLGLNLHLIDTPSLRLDDPAHLQRLAETVERVRPSLLILDPLVRLHSADENAVREIAPILDRLRRLQRRFQSAVLLVHHARKSGGARPGQALRGSSELFAWADNVLVLRRRQQRILLSSDHRAAANLHDLGLELATLPEGPALQLARPVPTSTPPPHAAPRERIRAILAEAGKPLSRRQIRDAARMRAETVGAALHELVRTGDAIQTPNGYQDRAALEPFPAPGPGG